MRYCTPISSKGQITIPKPIRDRLALAEGDSVAFVPAGHGILMIPRNKPVNSIFGILSRYSMPATSVTDYDDAIREGVAGHVEGRRKRKTDDAA